MNEQHGWDGLAAWIEWMRAAGWAVDVYEQPHGRTVTWLARTSRDGGWAQFSITAECAECVVGEGPGTPEGQHAVMDDLPSALRGCSPEAG